MLCLFPSNPLVSFGDFRIPFTVSLTTHGEVHTNFGTFSGKVSPQSIEDFLIDVLSNTNTMLIRPSEITALLNKLISTSATDRTFFRGSVTLINITANCTYPFFHNSSSFFGMMLNTPQRVFNGINCRFNRMIDFYD